jgi:hypothetical protein
VGDCPTAALLHQHPLLRSSLLHAVVPGHGACPRCPLPSPASCPPSLCPAALSSHHTSHSVLRHPPPPPLPSPSQPPSAPSCPPHPPAPGKHQGGPLWRDLLFRV